MHLLNDASVYFQISLWLFKMQTGCWWYIKSQPCHHESPLGADFILSFGFYRQINHIPSALEEVLFLWPDQIETAALSLGLLLLVSRKWTWRTKWNKIKEDNRGGSSGILFIMVTRHLSIVIRNCVENSVRSQQKDRITTLSPNTRWTWSPFFPVKHAVMPELGTRIAIFRIYFLPIPFCAPNTQNQSLSLPVEPLHSSRI